MIFRGQDGDLISTKPDQEYFKKVKAFIQAWENGQDHLEVKTSGSTGNPKNIRLSKEQIQASVNQTAEAFYLNQDCIFLCNLSIDFIAGKLMIIRALELGAELVVISPEGDFLENLGQYKYLLTRNMGKNFFAFVPMQLEKMLNNPQSAEILNTARATILGGAVVGERLLTKIQKIKTPVFATYGMTETVTHLAIKRLNGDKPDKYFKALPDTEIKLDVRGCLCAKNKSTDNKWIITNDLATLKKSNQFQLNGRIDGIINSGGVKLNLSEIETKIDKLGLITQPFFCFGIPDEILGQKLVLFVEDSSKDETLVKKLKRKLPKFEAPKQIVFVDLFTKTGSGKIDKIKTVDAYSISNK
ncbi:AMP-binding protein [Arcticibacterium luteifluviistationis]|uniref:O-succinylbenzoic acid--CoA ligase n=1 Tax=Arcticibacterium luteifluviistationis TaxID=1784714 RepID=A0A2Z4GCV8_9BACT|nr:AMP-binding protein [Arcticibacterium luteifluviistationis]AWV98865.1 O-succinylbenzoic acid--CoA ligase [Arcticibacterium luteifluviistationis]